MRKEQIFEALLGRRYEINISDECRAFYKNRKVLITGAAGSIGTNICEQLIICGLESLIMFDQSESGLYYLKEKLSCSRNDLNINVVVGNICNEEDVESLFKKYTPDIVFHAAAYKHVPLMESQPEVAVRTNVLGTKLLAKYAVQHGVLKFIFVSTDKAINPTSILGATKRIGELMIQSMNESKAHCSFVICRFGNVFNSEGSVFPIFERQIQRGGPITLTHTEMTRYFMSVSEASTFLLESAIVRYSGDILFYEMGEPVKILDLARKMKETSSSMEVEIEIVGLRPGEKLNEEIMIADGQINSTNNSKVFCSVSQLSNIDYLLGQLEMLEPMLKTNNQIGLIELIHNLVPEYRGLKSKFKHLNA